MAEFVGLAAILATGIWLVRTAPSRSAHNCSRRCIYHRIFDPINTLLGLFDDAQEGGAGLAVWWASRNAVAAAGAGRPPADGSLSVEAVTFGYLSGRPVCTTSSFHMGDGEHVALVGQRSGQDDAGQLIAGVPAESGLIRVAASSRRSRPRAVALGRRGARLAGTVLEDLVWPPLRRPTRRAHRLQQVGAGPAGSRRSPTGWARDGRRGRPSAHGDARPAAGAGPTDPGRSGWPSRRGQRRSGRAGARQLELAAAAALAGRSALIVAHRLSQAAVADRVSYSRGPHRRRPAPMTNCCAPAAATRGCASVGRRPRGGQADGDASAPADHQHGRSTVAGRGERRPRHDQPAMHGEITHPRSAPGPRPSTNRDATARCSTRSGRSHPAASGQQHTQQRSRHAVRRAGDHPERQRRGSRSDAASALTTVTRPPNRCRSAARRPACSSTAITRARRPTAGRHAPSPARFEHELTGPDVRAATTRGPRISQPDAKPKDRAVRPGTEAGTTHHHQCTWSYRRRYGARYRVSGAALTTAAVVGWSGRTCRCGGWVRSAGGSRRRCRFDCPAAVVSGVMMPLQ